MVEPMKFGLVVVVGHGGFAGDAGPHRDEEPVSYEAEVVGSVAWV